MDSVLVIAATDKGRELLSGLMKPYAGNVTTLSGCGEARRKLIECDYDLIIINTPLPDEFGHELAVELTQKTDAAILLLVKSELADDVACRVEDYGILVVSRPIHREAFYQSIKIVQTARRRMLGLRQENIKLQKKIEEIRLVDRAKCALIQYLGLTESQAHKYIEKQAMDLRQTRGSIAAEILKTYEN